ncbi:MAG: glycosyltransferase family 39 protein, partial [Candidatus Rokubacteria bacterium]|nr:glycosyltransferase family 39 protein [Candidatus Rokubacteria bacterium]
MSALRRRTALEWSLVSAAFAVIAFTIGVWVALDRRPPEWDHANHLQRVVECADDLARGDVRTVLARSSFYPPVVPCLAGLAYALAPSDAAAAQSVILAFLGLGMAAVYALGRRFAGGAGGVAAALAFGTAPFVVFSAMRFQLDLPLAAVIALALLLLLRTEDFGHRGASLLLGFVLGAGMLTKPPFAAYLLPPIAWTLARARGRRAFANATLALLVGALLALPWYGPRLFGLGPQIANRAFKQAAESGYPETFTAAALRFYPEWFATQFGVVAVLLFGVGLVVAARRRQAWLLAAFLVPFAAFALIQNKNLRYTLPLLPVAAVLAGVGLDALRGRLRAASAAALVVLAVAQVGATAFAVPGGVTIPLLGRPLALESPPMRTDWHHRDIMALIMRDQRGAAATVSVVPNHNFFSVSNFRYYGRRDGLPLEFAR